MNASGASLRQARTRKDVRLTYRAVGSSTGQREFTQTSSTSATWRMNLDQEVLKSLLVGISGV